MEVWVRGLDLCFVFVLVAFSLPLASDFSFITFCLALGLGYCRVFLTILLNPQLLVCCAPVSQRVSVLLPLPQESIAGAL